MKSKFIIALAAVSLAAKVFAGVPVETPQQHDARMEWFREAKFGMFIHWGVYSVPAGEWDGKTDYAEWIMESAHIPVSRYEQFAKEFNPVKFDAKVWVKTAKDAGMKYIVITAKHHDGFANFDTQASDWNIVKATSYGKDILKPLAAACRKYGVKLGFYYSQAQDWHEPNGAGNNNDFGPDDKKDFDQYLRGKAEPQVRELDVRPNGRVMFGEFRQP